MAAPSCAEKFHICGNAEMPTMAALPPPRSPGAFLAKENARWSEAVKSAGVTVE
jgi:hypothetical protein